MNDVTPFLTELGISDRISDDLRQAAQSRQFIPELNRHPDGVFYDFFYSSQIPQSGVSWSEFQDRQNWDFKHKLLPLMKTWAEGKWPGGPGTVLDLGCGSGIDLCYLGRAFPQKQFIGIESSAPAQAHVENRARKLGLSNVSVQVGDAFGDALPGGPASLRAGSQPLDKLGVLSLSNKGREPSTGCDALILNNVLDSAFPRARAVAGQLRQVRTLLQPAGKIWLSLSPVRASESEMERCVATACRRVHLAIEDHGRFDYAQGPRQVSHLWWNLGCSPEPARPWWQFWR